MTEDLYALDPRDRDPELVEDDPWAFFDDEVDPEWARPQPELVVSAQPAAGGDTP